MTDDKSKRGAQDRAKINISEAYEIKYWSEKFGVTVEQLKAAVSEVGNSTEAVENFLRNLSK